MARAAMWDRRLKLVRRFQSMGKLLDVDTGDGRFLQTSRAQGYEVTGTELSEAGAAFAQRNGLDVRMGQITDLDLPAGSFDVATIWHVLEHVPNPGAVLPTVWSCLRPGGVLVVAVPNEENFFVRRRVGLAKTSPFDPLQFGGEIHLTYFRPRTLRLTLQLNGFRVVEFGVDDGYFVRDLRMQSKLLIQQTIARSSGWHFAVDGGRS
jgi:2-polyprenyl-3-methyl-5-hydroxy-6-metoxy-1,4-benzoquinol methylase